MSEYDEFENFIVFDCANLISRNRVHSNIDNFAPNTSGRYKRRKRNGLRFGCFTEEFCLCLGI